MTLKLRGSLLRRFVSGEVIDEIRELLFRLRLGGSLGLANAKTAQAAIGDVDAEWRRRIDDVVSCPDNAYIPRVPQAGHTQDGLVTLHNGLQVSALGYYGPGVLNMLIENRGVHEPQEERAFGEVLKLLPANGTMIELGAYWGFYSLWFAQRIPNARCFLVEPNSANLLSGKINFRRAGFPAVFERAYAGREEGRAADGTRIVNVDAFCLRKRIAHVSVLHADIQGAEADMLRGAASMLGGQRIDYLFISTHDNALHQECIDILKGHAYVILASADCDKTYSDDGVVIARSSAVKGPDQLSISTKPTMPRPGAP